MIRLDKDDLQSMYSPMREDFSTRMHRMIHALPAQKEEKRMKHPSLRAILIGVLLLALMSTTAFALTRPAVLDWLLAAGSPASPELETSAQEVHAEASADGITARITGVVYDGRQLAFSYEVENAAPTQPVLVALDYTFTVDGQKATLPPVTDTPDTHLVPSPHLDVLPAKRNPVTGGDWSQVLTQPLDGLVNCEMTFIVYRPKKDFAILISPDSMLRDATVTDPSTLAEIADSRTTLESFTNAILIEDDAQDAEFWSAQGYTVLGQSGRPYYSVLDPRSNLVEATRIPVRFTFDADKAIFYDFSGTSHQLDDCTAEAITFRLSALTTYIHVYLVPTENSEAAAHALADQYGAVALTDENGAPVEYSGMDYCYSPSPDVICKDGQWLCRYLLDMPGLLHFPQSIRFTVQTGNLLHFDLTAK